jgi:uncharacterized delta-60 repeat protein
LESGARVVLILLTLKPMQRLLKVSLLFIFCCLCTFAKAQDTAFYKTTFFELSKEKRPIQQLAYNQAKASTLTRKGDILLVDKLDYFATSRGFKLYKFNIEGQLDSTFGQVGVAQQTLPEAYYQANDILEMPSGAILVAGVVRKEKMGVKAQSVIVKYFANGRIDTTFGKGGVEKGFFSDDFDAFYDIDGVRILLTPANDILLLNKSVNGEYEYKITLLRLDSTADWVQNGYFDRHSHFRQHYITNIAGTFDYTNFKHFSNGNIAVVGAYAKSLKNHKRQLGFVVMFNKNLRIDSSFANNGVLLTDLDSTRLQTIDDIAELPNGQFIILGSTYYSKPDAEKAAKLFLMRLDAHGKIDSTFADKGIAVFEEPNINDFGEKITVLNDGNLLVAYHTNGEGREFVHKYFAIFDANGSPFRPTKIDVWRYQVYVNFNFPYRAFFQYIARDYNRAIAK